MPTIFFKYRWDIVKCIIYTCTVHSIIDFDWHVCHENYEYVVYYQQYSCYTLIIFYRYFLIQLLCHSD